MSLAAIVASVSLTVSMVIMVASFRDSLDAWLERVLPADIYLRAASGGETAYLPPEAQARIATLPGVRRAEFLREQQLLLDRGAPANHPPGAQRRSGRIRARTLPIVGTPVVVANGAPPPAWVSEVAADLYGFAAGIDHRAADRRKGRALHRRRHLARLRAAAGRDHDRAPSATSS